MHGSSHAPMMPPVARAAAMAGLAAGVFALALAASYACLAYTRDLGQTAGAWPVNAITLVAALRTSGWRRGMVLAAGVLGEFAGRALIGDGALGSAFAAFCDGLEILTALALLKIFIGQGVDLDQRRHVVVFLLAAGLAAPLASAAAVAEGVSLVRHAYPTEIWGRWYVAHALGLLVTAPALLTLTRASLSRFGEALSRGRGVASLATLSLALLFLYGQTAYPLFFLIPPALIFLTFELGQAGASLGLLIVSLVTVVMCFYGHGPIAMIKGDLAARLWVLQWFLGAMAVAILPVAAALAKRERLQEDLRRALAKTEASEAAAVEALRISTLAQQIAGVGEWRRDYATGESVWSDQTYRLFGLDPADPENRKASSITLYHPDDRTRVEEVVRSAYKTGLPFNTKVRVIRADDGRERTLAFRGEADRCATGAVVSLIGVVRDVTDEETALRRAEESEARFRQLADASADVVIKVDREDIIQYASPSCRRYGYEPEDLTGRSIWTLAHPADGDKLKASLGALFESGAPDPALDRTYRFKTADGSYVWMEGASAVVYDDGRPEAVISQLRDVSERQAAIQALGESEARYRLLTENATDVIACYGQDGRFTFLSPSVRTVLGYEPEDLIDRPGQEIIHPDDLKHVMDSLSACVDNEAKGQTRLEYRAFRKDGQMIWVEGHPNAIFNAQGRFVSFQSVLRDITARKTVEAALAESELRYRVIAENATDVISRTAVDGTLIYLSPSIQAVTGYAPEELLGQNLFDYVHPEDAERTAHIYRSILRGTRQNASPISYRARNKDGDYRWLEGNPTALFDAEGRATEMIDVVRDVSARVALESELRAARDAAEAAAAVKSDFMANMSHEIRTPLTAILGFTKLLSIRETLDDTASLYVKRVSAAGEALLAIVNDILDFSKLEAGQVVITARPTAPQDLIRDALSMFAPQAEAKGVELRFEAQGEIPRALSIDGDRVRQILLNLLGNALKFTDQGSVAVATSFDPQRERLRVEVRDTGAGLSQAQQTRLFKRFSQVDASTTRRHGGTGLGLAICKGLVEAMDGSIGVTSREGEGSTFHFEINAPRALMEGEWRAAAPSAELDGVRVLVADDNRINRELTRALLEPLGMDVTEAEDGACALDRATFIPFDIILMDLRMPLLDGAAATSRIRSGEGPNRDVPILAFTADADLPELLKTGSEFDGVVRKPLVPSELLATLARCLNWPDEAEEPEEVAGFVS